MGHLGCLFGDILRSPPIAHPFLSTGNAGYKVGPVPVTNGVITPLLGITKTKLSLVGAHLVPRVNIQVMSRRFLYPKMFKVSSTDIKVIKNKKRTPNQCIKSTY